MTSFYRDYGKRLLDLLIAVPMLIGLSPILVTIAVLVRIRLGSPILFTQLRPGCGTRPFRLIKFRTMAAGLGSNGQPLSDEQRLTRFGRILRSTSLDELPELWNVVRGEMSLVGPRPLLMDYCSYYSSRQTRRHDVRPGLTGLAQVNGRNAISWQQRFEYDVQYVENLSLRLDVWILAKTLRAVLLRDGISATDHATMPRFDPAIEPDPVLADRHVA